MKERTASALGRAARLAGAHGLDRDFGKIGQQALDLGGFADALASLEGDEAGAAGLGSVEH